MPGSIHELRCPSCSRVSQIHTGTSYCWEHGNRWEFEQWACTSCQRLVSRQTEHCCREQGPVCEICQADLEPWPGRIWHDRGPDGMVGAERLEGPCPGCGTTITLADTTGLISLWD